MEVDQLGPFEEVIDQIKCTYPKSASGKEGLMIITNCRILWKPSAEAYFPVNILRAQISVDNKKQIAIMKQYNQKQQYWVLRIDTPATEDSPDLKYYFRFYGDRAEQECAECERVLNDKVPTSIQQRVQFLGEEALQKLEILAQNNQLKQDFQQRVIQNNQGQDESQKPEKWEEGEFWEIYKDQMGS